MLLAYTTHIYATQHNKQRSISIGILRAADYFHFAGKNS